MNEQTYWGINSVTDQLISSFNDTWISFVGQVPEILLAILVVAVGLLIVNRITLLTRKVIIKRSADPLMTNFLTKAIKLLLGGIVVIFALRTAGLDGVATGLFTAAGASAVIIGFAFRDIGENFISGIILSFNRPFDLNDTVSIDDIFGKVTALEFRYTKLKTFDGRDVYIPNSDVIKKAVYNYTEDGYYRLEFKVGIDYEDKVQEAEDLIVRIVRSTAGVIENEQHETFVTVDELGVSTVNLKVFFWVDTKEYRKQALIIRGRVMSNVKEHLAKEGFTLPADILELKLNSAQSSIPITVKASEPSHKLQ